MVPLCSCSPIYSCNSVCTVSTRSFFEGCQNVSLRLKKPFFMHLCVFMWLMCTREEMIRCPSCTTLRCTSTNSYSSDLVLLPVCVCFSERIRLTSCVLPELCCDEATFCWLHIKITSPSLGSDSSLSDCSSSRQPDSQVSSTDALAHFCMCASVCVNKCVREHTSC